VPNSFVRKMVAQLYSERGQSTEKYYFGWIAERVSGGNAGALGWYCIMFLR
jgi:hypothetical protein